MKQYTANSNDNDVRLSRFVQRVAPLLPASAMYKGFRNKRIKVNGQRATPEYRLQAGDVVQLYLNDEFFSAGAASPAAPAATFGFVWQNADVAVLYKPAGLLSHSDAVGVPNLLDSFTQTLIAAKEYDPASANGFAPALCNRLDRGTEGLVLAAKTYPGLRDTNALIKAGLVHKHYLCITLGAPPEGRHTAWLLRDTDTKTVQVTSDERPGAKKVITDVEVQAQHGGLALCRIGLVTGRTHQIRAHLAFFGTPVLGDGKYGSRAQNQRHGLNTQALCAWQLTLAAGLPPENTLAPLQGKSFTCGESAHLPKLWQRLQK